MRLILELGDRQVFEYFVDVHLNLISLGVVHHLVLLRQGAELFHSRVDLRAAQVETTKDFRLARGEAHLLLAQVTDFDARFLYVVPIIGMAPAALIHSIL